MPVEEGRSQMLGQLGRGMVQCPHHCIGSSRKNRKTRFLPALCRPRSGAVGKGLGCRIVPIM